MTPSDFFKPWESRVAGWDEALAKINEMIDRAGSSRDLAWRGVADSKYALHSSIYRRFVDAGVSSPAELQLVEFEKQLLNVARSKWRFDDKSALEILAHLQHYGGPTRLLDVSFNPLASLWFAVEQKYDVRGQPIADTDGRLFAFDITNRSITLDKHWGGRDLPWGSSPDKWQRQLPYVWRPPSYNDRIPAQNSAFLIGGVPQFWAGDNTKYRKSPGDGGRAAYWSIEEVRQASSVHVWMSNPDRKPQDSATPTYTIIIEADAKSAIREALERYYGFNTGSIYPDLFGLARYGADSVRI